MKKIVLVLLFVLIAGFMLCNTLYAQNLGYNLGFMNDGSKIALSGITPDIVCNKAIYSVVSPSLGIISYATDTAPFPNWLAAILNYIPAFGLGSFLQGDTMGGFIQLGLEGAGLAIIIITALSNPYLDIFYIGFATGILLMGGGVIFGVVRALLYQPPQITSKIGLFNRQNNIYNFSINYRWDF